MFEVTNYTLISMLASVKPIFIFRGFFITVSWRRLAYVHKQDGSCVREPILRQRTSDFNRRIS